MALDRSLSNDSSFQDNPYNGREYAFYSVDADQTFDRIDVDQTSDIIDADHDFDRIGTDQVS